MARPPGLCLLVLLGLGLGTGGSPSCWDPRGQPRRCMPVFENAAFGRAAQATNTCGSPPEDYCLQMGARHASTLCHRCDATDPRHHHNASFLTDFHSQEESTWWQSQSMAFGIQHPNSVNITLHLGKAYEITYVRLKFHTSRPESFAIYKRSRADRPWVPFQYYSASCEKTYGKRQRHYLRPGEDEQVAFCTDEFSDISPLSGGNVAFSTLEGRPSAYNFDGSPALQEWVTVTDLLISLNRLNTFGDDIFKDPKVLQSYYYAISDFSVGGRCKCNGHASECAPDEAGQLVCVCQHNTAGTDCERCQPFYQDRPWARGTAEAANECLPCNCSGRSDECFYDRELYRRSGHGGHCRNCRDNTAGPHCERCQQNHYRWEQRAACQPCHCHPAGAWGCTESGSGCKTPAPAGAWRGGMVLVGSPSPGPQCDSSGTCVCKANVTGWKCECQPGWFNLQPHNPAGCTSCFCYGHSTACTAADGYEVTHVRSDFSQGGWPCLLVTLVGTGLHWQPWQTWYLHVLQTLLLSPLAEKFLQNQRLSYGQLLSLLRAVLRCMAAGLALSFLPRSFSNRLHEAEEGAEPSLSAFSFQRLLSNLTTLRLRVSRGPVQGGWLSLSEVRLTSARPGPGAQAGWVEECVCPPGYTGQFCQSCAPGFKREIPFGGPFISCVPCTCNQHGDCDPLGGHCRCLHNTEGPSCERCSPGFYGNPFVGRFDDCKPCPCPGHSPCTEMPGSGEVVCTHCPPGQRGKRCELCDDGFFGDPLGQRGPVHPCIPCQCHGNVDLNAVGNCDPVSGRCLRCLYNTTGEHCERCQLGFYGDALAPDPAGKCAPCDCNPDGSAPGQEGCDPSTGQCRCLPHVMGRACGLCQPGYYGLQPAVGCKSCECHPTGSRESGCHMVTGQCSCQPGVTGKQCDRCHHGFFGFSARGCRACNCSPLGSVTPQCHENSTCLCRPGFVGYKCDQCQTNFFLDPPSSRCQQCPACYGLVKDEADRLKARLQEMEEWLQETSCDARPGQSPVLGDAPRGDGLPSPHLLQGARATLLTQVGRLAGVLGTAQHHLSNASKATGCSGHGPPKTCILLSEIGAALQSAQREILRAADTLATTVRAPTGPRLPVGLVAILGGGGTHRDAAAQVEAVVGRALRASNASSELLRSLLEGNAMQKAQHQLEVKGTSQSISSHSLALTVLALGPNGRKGQFGDGWVVPTGMRKALGHRKGQAALSRRMALVQDRALTEAQRKIKQAEKTLGNFLSVSTAAQRTAREAEQVSGESTKRAQAMLQESKQARQHASQLATRANETQRELSRQEHEAEKLRGDLEEAQRVSQVPSGLYSRPLELVPEPLLPGSLPLIHVLSPCPGNLEQAVQVEAVLSAGRLELERLWLRLAAPGTLASQLSLLQQEAARQQEKIQAFESDLAEIRADKQNLEDILRSLPEGCSQWQ
uniref:Laminin subunit gamma 3 n=1 Tax=Accipiter nisus TaxID=211598 RepID=A0A8B9MT17_9AVES